MRIKELIVLFVLFVTINTKAQYIVPAAAQTKSILLYGGTAHIGDGTVIEKSAIGIVNGKISFVKDLSKDAVDKAGFQEVIDITGKHVYPGIIAANATLGLTEVGAVRATHDLSEVGGMNPNARALIAYNTDSKIIPTVRSNGILITQATPRDGIISGTSSIMELDGWNWQDAVFKADDGIHMNWPHWRADPGAAEKNKEYEKQLESLKKFFADSKAYFEAGTSIQEKDLKLEAMRGLFDGTKTLYIHSNLSKEITESVTFSKQMGVKKIVLAGGKDSWMITDFLKENNVSVVLCRLHELPERSDDDIDMVYKTPSLLQKAGVLFCLNYECGMEAMGMRNLPFVAGTAAAYGLTKEEALSAITLNTAKILGIDNRLGSLFAGKDATLFISTGDALDMRTNNVVLAYIRGKKIDLNTEQKMLYEVYKGKYGIK